MVVYLTAIVASIFYAMNVPLRIAFTLHVGDEWWIRVGVGLFSAKYIVVKRLDFSVEWLREMMRKPRKKMPKGALQAGLRAGEHFIRHSKVTGGQLSMRIGTGDAAKTAMVCGAVEGAVRAMNAVGGGLKRAKITPDFGQKGLMLSAGGMVYVRVGHIMVAALVGAHYMVSGRIREQWKSIQLKAS